MINLSKFGYNILQIETTAACNMACSFCPYPLKEDKSTKLNLDKIKDILSQVNPEDEKFKYLTFSQFNEPLLDNRIFQITEFAQKLNFKVYFVTNGLLLNKEKNINELLRLKPEVKISLQVLDNSKHMRARGLNLELDRYLNSIINFCKLAKNSNINIDIDIGCNFNENNFSNSFKKFLGFSNGDPSVPDTLKETWEFLIPIIKKFYEIDGKLGQNEFISFLENKKNFKKIKKNYIYQEGFELFKNIRIKIKPFFYGNRIKDFYPVNNNFACKSEILAIQADGNVVPCCLAYDSSISIGSIHSQNLNDILTNNIFLKNLRKKGNDKHMTCKKCFGEQTKRGAFFRNIINSFKSW